MRERRRLRLGSKRYFNRPCYQEEKINLSNESLSLAKQPRKRLNIGEQGHLSDLCIGQKARVIAVHNDSRPLRRRLLDMGITKGVEILVKKKAPLGDPVDIELRGYELCIRLEDMKNIDIEVIA